MCTKCRHGGCSACVLDDGEGAGARPRNMDELVRKARSTRTVSQVRLLARLGVCC